jgi:aspartate aminotransferase
MKSTVNKDVIPFLKVSEMAENLIGSEIIKLAGEVKEKMKSGEKIYNFTIGDFDPKIFPIPSLLLDEIIKAYQEGHTNYPAANGMAELRKAVSRYLHIRGGLEYNEDQVLISGGSRPLIYAVYQALLNPGDNVIFPVPSWNNNHYCHLSGANQQFVEVSEITNFMPTAKDLAPHISNASLIALCSPLNPTGTVFTAQVLEDICHLILDENRKRGSSKKPLYLLYDQVYWQLTFGNNAHHDPVSICPEMKNFTIYIDGISKSLAATGVRVGWAFGPQRIIDKMKAILSHVGAWAPKAEQMATAKFLENDQALETYMHSFKNAIEERLVAFYNGFKSLKNQGYKVNAIEPQAAMYLTVSIDAIGKETQRGKKLLNAEDVTNYLLDEAKIALVPFYAFGASKKSPWFRLSVGTAKMEEILGFFDNLKKALDKLQD